MFANVPQIGVVRILKKKIMIQIDEQKLRQLFKNRSNCYADAEDVVQAMDEDCFIETINEALRLFAVVGRSEQFPQNFCTLNQNTCGKGSGCKYPHCHL